MAEARGGTTVQKGTPSDNSVVSSEASPFGPGSTAPGCLPARLSLRIESARPCHALCFTPVAFFLPFPTSRS